MTNTHPAKFTKLVTLLKELFQLDQPDLDFGIYRIMHAKAGEVTQFLERDLLPQVKEAFAQYQSADGAELKKKLEQMVAQLAEAGVDPESAPKVKELREQLKGAVDIGALENEVYDHLYSFFRRYYSEGDFLAKRVYKPGVYAIPYEGEEVTLHWANKDQYYIKTSEYLRDYAFRLKPEAKEGEDPMRVRFKLVDAAEGEHGNVKAAEGKDRVFVLADEDFIAEVDGELELRFEYRPATLEDWPADQRDGKKKPPTQKDLSAFAVVFILAAGADFANWLTELGKTHVKANGEQADYSRLEAHMRRYTARNTFDYFIHKDLDGFLRRELDFYIKNEVMHLDDVESETAPRVEQYLSKIKMIRRIAGKIIDFLAQLENFQRKLWLKKKFVVGSDWLVAISQVPDELLPEVCTNLAQLDEWKTLHSLHELPADVTRPAYSEPLTPEYLRAHPSLMVDTRHFDAAFVARLLDEAGDLDEKADGVLMHSENFQALSLMQGRYREKVQCIYIDPPYNTEQDRVSGKFLYKDSYARSSWLALMSSRLEQMRSLSKNNGVLFASIDEHEVHRLLEVSQNVFPDRIGLFTWVKKKKGSHLSKVVRDMTEYVIAVTPDRSGVELFGENAYADKAQPLAKRTNRPKELVFPASTVQTTLSDGVYQSGVYGSGTSALTFMNQFHVVDQKVQTELRVTGPFVWKQETLNEELRGGSQVSLSKKFGFNVLRSGQEDRVKRPSTLLDTVSGVGTNEDASAELISIFGEEGVASYPKPTSLVAYLVRACTQGDDSCVLDAFAGSGTTGHSVIQLNREDEARRRFVLVEMSHYFDTVLVPRIKKVSFTPEWAGGKPRRLASSEEADRSPRLIKVLRLESYEDTLNNLALSRSTQQQAALDFDSAQGADGLREQYLLRYQLDVESHGSASLLNIAAFTDPTAYKLLVKTPGSDESRKVNVDLLVTFNWLLGLTVQHIAAPRSFAVGFERDGEGRLQINGRLRQDAAGPWWFRTVTGTTPEGRRTLVIWRKLTGDAEQDNLVLETWFRDKQAFSVRDAEFDLIYVNGDNTLENIRLEDESWKVRLTEEDFQRLMFEGTD